jgi:hypothetical protein
MGGKGSSVDYSAKEKNIKKNPSVYININRV